MAGTIIFYAILLTVAIAAMWALPEILTRLADRPTDQTLAIITTLERDCFTAQRHAQRAEELLRMNGIPIPVTPDLAHRHGS